MKRAAPVEINAGSMADIAFLLLIFFLVTTTLEQDEGLPSILPPKSIAPPSPRSDRNVLEILVDAEGEIMIEGERVALSAIREEVILFYTNPEKSSRYPELKPLLSSEEGQALPSDVQILVQNRFTLPHSAIISLQSHRSTNYAAYIAVQNELTAGLNILRDDLSKEAFGISYRSLNPSINDDRRKIMAIRAVYPRRISEAEPWEED